MDLFEAIGTQWAMRRLKDDPVSDEDVWKILDAATMAPSGGNSQPWNFIVVRNAETKRKLFSVATTLTSWPWRTNRRTRSHAL